MLSIALGALAFPSLLAYDCADLRDLPALRWLTLCLAAGLSLAALVTGLLHSGSLQLPLGVRVASGLVGVFFLSLLIVSYFVEVPLRRGGERVLVSTGTYALSRHPGAIWFALVSASVGLASASRPLLAAAPVWSCLNMLYVAVQDRLIFPRLFGEAYREYQRDVPFLMPTSRSLQRCIATWTTGRSSECRPQ